jgi:hypothetical protein
MHSREILTCGCSLFQILEVSNIVTPHDVNCPLFSDSVLLGISASLSPLMVGSVIDFIMTRSCRQKWDGLEVQVLEGCRHPRQLAVRVEVT